MKLESPMNVPEELKQWVEEKQKHLDWFLANDPKNYLEARKQFTEEYEAKLKSSRM